MEELLGKFVMSYLLMPLIAVLLGSVMFFIAKKNQLLRNRKLIGYCIIMVILLVAPATALWLNTVSCHIFTCFHYCFIFFWELYISKR